MNIVKIMGGLGNQLFQYAFGKTQMLNGISVYFTNSSYSDDKIEKQVWKRNYNLDKFKIEDIRLKDSVKHIRFIKESNKGYDPKLLKQDACFFHGYWQYLDYYQANKALWKQLFQIKEEFYIDSYLKYKDMITNSMSVAVHVRRGDYLLLNAQYAQPFSYYFKAMQEIKGKYFIFSDDIEWCKEKFLPEYFTGDITFVEGNAEYLDFELLRLCKHKILSASTFSWWAAFLNDAGTVIVPEKWDDYKSSHMIYPENWIKMNQDVI